MRTAELPSSSLHLRSQETAAHGPLQEPLLRLPYRAIGILDRYLSSIHSCTSTSRASTKWGSRRMSLGRKWDTPSPLILSDHSCGLRYHSRPYFRALQIRAMSHSVKIRATSISYGIRTTAC